MPLRPWLERLRGKMTALFSHKTTKTLTATAIVAALAILFVHVAPTHAAPGDFADTVLDTVYTGVSKMLEAVIHLLVGFVLWLTSALISLAKYNEFVGASPVVIGWTLVRDVVNMFFIVVLLIVAFSTIIGYQPFHYKGVLPKLLLMVVLINFSKTLVGVMIDFSSVVTLTFVNGFQAAAGGNFIQAFQLTKIATFSAGKQPDMLEIIMAEVLGIWVLVTACTTIGVMCIYFLGRIVALWYLLILAPIAFFGTALPDKMQKAMASLTKEWWSRLSVALTGGPTVAFFLWLSLAVVQKDPNFGSGMYKPSSQAEVDSAAPAVSKVAEPGNLFSMMISVAMMLTGLTTAVSVTGQLDSTLGKAAQNLKNRGGPVGILRTAGFAGARAAGRTAGRAASATAGFADRRLGITKGISTGLLNNAQMYADASRDPRAGRVSRFANRIAAGAAGAAGAKGMQTVAARGAADEKAIAERTKGLEGAQRLQALRAFGTAQGGAFGNRDIMKKTDVQAAAIATSAPYRKEQESKQRAAFEKEYLKPKMSEAQQEQAKTQAKDDASAKVKTQYMKDLTSGRATMEAAGNYDGVDKIDAVYKSDPSLYEKQKDIVKNVSSGLDDPKQYFQSTKNAAFEDNRVAKELATQAGLIKPNGGFDFDKAKDDHEVGKFLVDKDGNWKGARGKAFAKGLAGGGAAAAAAATAAASTQRSEGDRAAERHQTLQRARQAAGGGTGAPQAGPAAAQAAPTVPLATPRPPVQQAPRSSEEEAELAAVDAGWENVPTGVAPPPASVAASAQAVEADTAARYGDWTARQAPANPAAASPAPVQSSAPGQPNVEAFTAPRPSVIRAEQRRAGQPNETRDINRQTFVDNNTRPQPPRPTPGSGRGRGRGRGNA